MTLVDQHIENQRIADVGGDPAAGRPADGAGEITLSEGPGGVLRLTRRGDRSYLKVKIVQAAPLTAPLRYISFLDEKGGEIAAVGELGELDPNSQRLARLALDRFYVVAEIRQIHSLRLEMGVSFWEVETDRGPRAFTLKDLQENARGLGPGRILLVDADGNRYKILDTRRLDQASRRALDIVL